MDIRVKRGDLLRELQVIQPIVAGKHTIPILANVLLRAELGVLHLSATDLDIALACSCPAIVTTPGATTLPAAKLCEMVKALPPDAEIGLAHTAGGAGVTVTGAGFRARLGELSPEDFPALSEPTGQATVFPAAALRWLLRSRFIVSDSDTKSIPYAAGMLLRIEAASLTAVTTDGRRMAVAVAPRETNTPTDDAVVPRKTVLALVEQLSDLANDAPVTYMRGENLLFFEIAGRLLTSRVLDAKYPAWQRVIPTKGLSPLTVNRALLQETVQRVGLVSDEVFRKISIQADTNALAISAQSIELGDADERLVVTYAGPTVVLKFAQPFLIEFLKAMDTEQVTLALPETGTGAMLLTPVGSEREFSYILMPIVG